MPHRRCPCCNLPAPSLGGVFFGADIIIAFCPRCEEQHDRLPTKQQRRRLDIARARAMAHPDRYLVAVLPDAGAAQLAAGLIAHPVLGQEAMRAVGWLSA